MTGGKKTTLVTPFFFFQFIDQILVIPNSLFPLLTFGPSNEALRYKN